MGKDLNPGLTANALLLHYTTSHPFLESQIQWKFQVWLGPFSFVRQGSFDPKYENWGEGKAGSSKWMETRWKGFLLIFGAPGPSSRPDVK